MNSVSWKEKQRTANNEKQKRIAYLLYGRGYINKLCTGILYDKHGQPHVCIDEYMKRHLEIKLISSIVTKAETV